MAGVDSGGQTVVTLLALWFHFFFQSTSSSGVSDCVSVPWLPWRCYSYHNSKVDWETAQQRCHGLGLRLAVVENQQLLDFINITFPYPSVRSKAVWVGLRRQANGDTDFWLNGVALNLSAYPSSPPRVSRRGGQGDMDQFCSRMEDDGSLDDNRCRRNSRFFCEGYRPSTFRRRQPGSVLSSTAATGQEVTSPRTSLTVIECTRRCDAISDCVALSHRDSRCWHHVMRDGENFLVSRSADVYQRVQL